MVAGLIGWRKEMDWNTDLDAAPYDKTVLVDCERFQQVVEAIRYRKSGWWCTFSVNGVRECRPIAWMNKLPRFADQGDNA